MNRINRCLFRVFVIVALAVTTSVSAKNKKEIVYVFGCSTSFNDSTVYFTDIQQIDNARINDKNKFLVNREEYSYQLRNYMSEKGHSHRTCFVSFSMKKADVEKKMIKLRKRYMKNGGYDVKFLPSNEFRFHAIEQEAGE